MKQVLSAHQYQWKISNLLDLYIFQNELCYLFTFIVPRHAKFRENPWSGFRDKFVTIGQTHMEEGEIMVPIAFTG